MKNSTILVVVGIDVSSETLARKLEVIRDNAARAAILIVEEMPQFPYYALGVPPFGPIEVPAEWQEEVAAGNAALKARAEEIEALLQQHDVSGEVTTFAADAPQIAEAVARRAMICDMAIVSDELRASENLFRQAVHGILFQSPIGLLLNDPKAIALSAPKRIFVAWNTHLHTARAVHQALPLLQMAESVTIGTIDPIMEEYRDGEDPGVDVAKWLTHHGCNVTVQQSPSGGQDIGGCILDRSKELAADLIVMGSYVHSRAREAVFGGTTRTLIDQTCRAVFLGH